MRRFPQMSESQRIGELGTVIVEKIVRKDLGWIFRRVPQESDFGIDAYLDVVDNTGNVTGKSFAVQIKAGKSYRSTTTDYGFMYVGEFRHLNLFMNLPTPTLLIVCDEQAEIAWWQLFCADEIVPSELHWKLLIPYAQTLNSSTKSKLETLAGDARDYVGELREKWAFRDKFRQAEIVILQVTQGEIKALLTERVVGYLNSISGSLESAMAYQGKITLAIDGYDHLEKELWEFDQVRKWMKKFERQFNYAFWFFSTEPKLAPLLSLMFCVCDSKVVYRDHDVRRALTVTQPRKKMNFITRSFQGLNQFTDRMGIPLSENQRVSSNVGDFFTFAQEEGDALWLKGATSNRPSL